MKNDPRVLISILNWNGLETTRACLQSLRNLVYPNYRIVVIDNASAQDEVSVLAVEFPQVEFIRNPQNLGFAGGHNRAIEDAITSGYDYIWILNNDCTIAADDLAKLVDLAESDPGIGLVSPLIALPPSNGKETLQFAGAWHDWKKLITVRPDQPALVKEKEASDPKDMWLTGTALLARCAALKTIGGLDPRYFAYYEDNEISVRATRHGFVNRMAFDVSVRHHSFGNSYDRPPHYFYLCSRNSLLFWSENTPLEYRRRLRRRLVCRILGEARNLFDSGRIEQAIACVAGVRDGLLGRFGRQDMNFGGKWWMRRVARYFPYRFTRIYE